MAENKDNVEIGDVLASQEELEAAMCVLAGSDPDNCSYSRGYVKRQALFACNTCTPSGADSEPAGVCLACANKCHDGHDIFELYTKRDFRCDCGNSKFGEFQCQLIPAKDEKNIKNLYNHNYNGCYCSCDRPYPDTDEQATNEDEMIQCVICEDWFHSMHLGCTVVEPEELQEMVCETCMDKAPFLWTYAGHFAVTPVVDIEDAVLEVDVEEGVEQEVAVTEEKEVTEQLEASEPCLSGHDNSSNSAQESNRSSRCKRTHDELTASTAQATAKSQGCKLKRLQAQGPERLRQGAVFWPYSWRSELCTCTSCKRAYVSAEVQFLMDQTDTILAYENKGMEEPFGQHPLMALTNSLSRAHQLEVIYGYNELTTSITEFFDQYAAEGKEVTVEAVHELFEELRAKKRRRTSK